MPRTASRRYQKWDVKFDPAVISSRFTAVKPVAEGNAQDGLIPFADFDFNLASLLDMNAVAGPDRAKYRAFGRKLLAASYKVSGKSLDHIALGLKNYFVTSYGCDPSIIDQIIQFVLGYTPTY
jgi:hypothetical protein